MSLHKVSVHFKNGYFLDWPSCEKGHFHKRPEMRRKFSLTRICRTHIFYLTWKITGKGNWNSYTWTFILCNLWSHQSRLMAGSFPKYIIFSLRYFLYQKEVCSFRKFSDRTICNLFSMMSNTTLADKVGRPNPEQFTYFLTEFAHQ